MLERIFKSLQLVLLALIYLPSLGIVILFEAKWKELLGEFGL